MKLYATPGSPYARMARMVVIEKGLASGAGPSPRICGGTGPRCACGSAAETAMIASADAVNHNGFFMIAATSIRMMRPVAFRRSGDA